MCWGIPLHVWDLENIKKIVVAVGEVVDFDDNVEDPNNQPQCAGVH